VSPPWVGKCASADMTAIRRQTAGSVCADRRYIRVDSCHGGLTPPALVLVYERLPTKKRFLRCTDACSPKSGGREPAVGVSIALAKALPQSRRRPPALCSRTPVQCRSFTTAGLRQPLLVARGLFAAKCTLRNAESHMQQERRASARRGCEYRTCKGASAKSQETARGLCADRRCIRVERRRKGPTLVPAPALRDFQSLCSRAGFPRGADAPRSCIAMRERLSAEKRFLRCTNARRPGAAGVSPPWLGKRACNTDTAHVRGHSSRAETIAAGVSPPWAWETRLRRLASVRFRKVAGDRPRCVCGSPLHSR
jgi:hypothetical protein